MRSILKFVWNMFSNPKKLVVVLGATGAGKSKLALDIATRCHGEIISVDSMQVYKGLDIVTNKVSKEELKMCRHHMIGFLDPRNEFTIVDFQEQTLKLIDDIQSRKKVPILVGGTNYYVQSILWDLLLKTKSNSQFSEANETKRKEMWETESSVLHKMLMEVDPASAKVIHPKDKRKIVRALEVFKQTGKLQSNLIEEQRRQTGGGSLGGPLRFPGACLLWVRSEPDVLRERIYKRVEKMIDQGLLKELKDFHEDFNKERLAKGLEPDYEHGIFQSIGFKEFHDYLTADATTEEKTKEKMLEEATEQMKLATWQYAKYQIKFIRKRIVNRSNALPVYPLDATDPTLWEENVLHPSLKVLTSCDVFDFGDAVPQQTKVVEPLAKSTESDSDGKTLHTCNLCGGLTMAKNNWEGHLQSKRHKNNFGKWKKSLSHTSAILETRQQQLTTVDPNNQTE